MVYKHEVIETSKEDVAYFQEKLDKCLEKNSPEACEKILRQLELLSDSLIVYKLKHPRRTTDERNVWYMPVGDDQVMK